MSEAYLYNGDAWQSITPPFWYGQVFTPRQDHELSYIDLEMNWGLAVAQPLIWLHSANPDGTPKNDYLSRSGYFYLPKGKTRGKLRVRVPMQPDLDSDADLIPDGWELNNALDPINTSDAQDDFDGDNLINLEEYNLGTDPNDADTDDDLLPDKWEVDNSLSPLNNMDAFIDIDADGLTTIQEYFLQTDFLDYDSDNDGHSDGDEVAAGTNPLDANDFPSPPTSEPEELSLAISLLIAGIALAAAIVVQGFLRRSRPAAAPPKPSKELPAVQKK